MEGVDVGELEKAFRRQVHRCQELLECDTEDKSIVKAHLSSRSAVSTLQKFTNTSKKKPEQRAQLLKSCLQQYSHSILDYTYYHECAMTNSKFTDDSSLAIVCGIIHTLSLPAQLCEHAPGLLAVLGTEIVECLYWRVGALLYMYCYNMYERMEEGLRVDQWKLLECCCAGVGHLRLMLSSRAPLEDDEDYLSCDPDMVKLLKLGVFSDIHMLSLMYAGDMCYWMWTLLSPTPSATPTPAQDKPHPQQQKPESAVRTVKSPPDSNSDTNGRQITSSDDLEPGHTPPESNGSESHDSRIHTATSSSDMPVTTPSDHTSSAPPSPSSAEQVQISAGDKQVQTSANEVQSASSEAVQPAGLTPAVASLLESGAKGLHSSTPTTGTSLSDASSEGSSLLMAYSESESSSVFPESSSSGVPHTPPSVPSSELSTRDSTSSSSVMPCSSSSSEGKATAGSEESPSSSDMPVVVGSEGGKDVGSPVLATGGGGEESASNMSSSAGSGGVDGKISSVSDAQPASPVLSGDASGVSGVSRPVSSIPVVTSAAMSDLSLSQDAAKPGGGGNKDSLPKAKATPTITPTATPANAERIASKLESVSLGGSPGVGAKSEGKKGRRGVAPKWSRPLPPQCDLYHVMHHTCGREAESRWKGEFDPLKQGMELLSKYIETARGPLKGLGWDYSRAVGLMVKFKKASAASGKSSK